jgi:gluconolactonase
MRHTFIALLLTALANAPFAQSSEPIAVEPGRTIGEVERLDPAIDKLVPTDAKIEVLVDGLDWCEGPMSSVRGTIYFSDIPRNSIYEWSEDSGVTLAFRPSGYSGESTRGGESGSNGLAQGPLGLIACQHGDRRLAQIVECKPRHSFKTIADNYNGRRFNSPNDLAIHSSGAIYFTDPPYGLEKGANDPARELDFCGVFRVGTDGKVTLLTKELERPNGIAFSPDEKTLYVAQSLEAKPVVMAYPVENDGSIGEGRVFFDAMELSKTRRGMPDGMAVDKAGNVFATGPGGVLVLDSTGKHLGSIRVGQLISNCCFGDDGQTLYMTCDRYLCRIKLSTTGVGF